MTEAVSQAALPICGSPNLTPRLQIVPRRRGARRATFAFGGYISRPGHVWFQRNGRFPEPRELKLESKEAPCIIRPVRGATPGLGHPAIP